MSILSNRNFRFCNEIVWYDFKADFSVQSFSVLLIHPLFATVFVPPIVIALKHDRVKMLTRELDDRHGGFICLSEWGELLKTFS